LRIQELAARRSEQRQPAAAHGTVFSASAANANVHDNLLQLIRALWSGRMWRLPQDDPTLGGRRFDRKRLCGAFARVRQLARRDGRRNAMNLAAGDENVG